jgi:hypothetical protein
VPEEVIEFLSRYGDTYINKPSQCVGEGEEKEVGEEDLQEDPEQSEATVLLKVMDGLSTKRYDNYDSWLKIGMVCYNEGLPLPFWDACSQRSDNYQSGACGKKWLSFKEKGKLTEATLWYWLKQDNPKVFAGIFVALDKETGKISTNNPDFGMLLEAADLRTPEATALFNEAGMSGNPETVHEFNTAYLGKVAEILVGANVIIKVKHQADRNDREKTNSVISKVIKG